MTRRDLGPLVALAAVIAGLLLGERAGGAPALVALATGVVGLVGAWLVDGPTRVVVAALALGLLGTAMMQRALDGLARHPLAAAVASGAPVTLEGVLVSDPAGQRFGADALLHVDGFARIVLVRATGTDAGRLRVLEAGDHVEVAGHLTSVPRTGFDARARWNHAVAILTDTEVHAFRPPRGGLASVANHARALVLEGTKPLDPNARALLAGFLLGDTRALPDQITDEYRVSGLSHLLAVSGANVAFVLLVCAPLLRRLSLVPRTGLALAVIVCFVAATRFEPSVLRASTLTSVTILTSFVGRPVSRVRGLVLAIVALLLLDPFLVHSIGFHLSCAASGGIAVFARPLARRLRGPALLREPLAVSVAAQLGVTPVLLLTFGSVPVISPVANLLAYPAAEAIGVFGLAASVVGGIVPPIGIVLAPITTALLAWVTAVAHHTAGVGGNIDVRGALAITALATITVIVRRVRRRKSQFILGFRGSEG